LEKSHGYAGTCAAECAYVTSLQRLLADLTQLYCCCTCCTFTCCQANELEYATKYYAAILARSTGKDLATCQKEYLSRWVQLLCFFSLRHACS
jgi:hypothetical protein